MWPVGQNQKETPTDKGKVAVCKAAQQRGARVKGGPFLHCQPRQKGGRRQQRRQHPATPGCTMLTEAGRTLLSLGVPTTADTDPPKLQPRLSPHRHAHTATGGRRPRSHTCLALDAAGPPGRAHHLPPLLPPAPKGKELDSSGCSSHLVTTSGVFGAPQGW